MSDILYVSLMGIFGTVSLVTPLTPCQTYLKKEFWHMEYRGNLTLSRYFEKFKHPFILITFKKKSIYSGELYVDIKV